MDAAPAVATGLLIARVHNARIISLTVSRHAYPAARAFVVIVTVASAHPISIACAVATIFLIKCRHGAV